MRAAAVALVALCWSVTTLASQIVLQAREVVLARTDAALVADVRTVDIDESDPHWRVLTLKIKPVRVVFGEVALKRRMRCSYREGRPHRRGELTLSPLVSGSGSEFKVRRGQRALLLLAASGSDDADCAILRIEPAKQADTIEAEHAAATSSRAQTPPVEVPQ